MRDDTSVSKTECGLSAVSCHLPVGGLWVSLVGAQLCVDLGFHGRAGRLIYKLNATTDWPVGGSSKQQETKFQKGFFFFSF